jgi:hypothetical protein
VASFESGILGEGIRRGRGGSEGKEFEGEREPAREWVADDGGGKRNWGVGILWNAVTASDKESS